MQVVEVASEVLIDGPVDLGTVVAFADHGVGVVVASDGARATVRPARGAAPAPGDVVTEGARRTHPFSAPSHARGGVTVGFGGPRWTGSPWWSGSVEAWARWGWVVTELDAASRPPAVAVTGRAGGELAGIAAGGVELGLSPDTVWGPGYPPTVRPVAGPWVRLGGRDGLNGELSVGFGALGATDLGARLHVPLGRDVAVLAEASFALSDPRAVDRDGVGLAGNLRRWGGPGTVRVEGWVLSVADEREVDPYEGEGPAFELRGGYRW